jgi:antitoxin HicB
MLLPLCYPAVFEQAAPTIIVRFRDFPEAISEGATRDEALANAVDCLDAALHFRMKDGQAIPAPSDQGAGEIGVVPTTDVAMRVALYQAYRSSGLSLSDFAQRVDMNAARVREIVGTHRPFDLRKVGAALRRVGKPVVLSVEAA